MKMIALDLNYCLLTSLMIALLAQNKPDCVEATGTMSAKLAKDQRDARTWLTVYDRQAERIYRQTNTAMWTYYTDMSPSNKNNMLKQLLSKGAFERTQARHALSWDWRKFSDVTVRRQLQQITSIGASALNGRGKYLRLKEVQTDIEELYATGNVCVSPALCFHGLHGFNKYFRSLKNTSDLQAAWAKWSDVTGRPVRPLYGEYVQLTNEAYRQLGYRDAGEYWRSGTGSESVLDDIDRVWQEVRPLYELLQVYVRKMLKGYHFSGRRPFPTSGHIPSHLLGDVLASDWAGKYDIVLPYPGIGNLDISMALQRQNVTGERMARIAATFYDSMGFPDLPLTFWKLSYFRKPDRRSFSCTPRIWWLGKDDIRMEACLSADSQSYQKAHTLIGRAQYAVQMEALPVALRKQPFQGLIDAVGGAIGLSAASPTYLREIGLLGGITYDTKSDINFLMLMALRVLPALSYAYVKDQWRWGVFNGATTSPVYNTAWWALRCKHQGISSPGTRSERDFDAGSDPSIASEETYLSDFVSLVAQYQLHKALCQVGNHQGLPHTCSLHSSTQAGNKLREMMKLGSSQPWQVVMETVTGKRGLDSGPLLEYFQPLYTWLRSEVSSYRKKDQQLWTEECPQNIISGSSVLISGLLPFFIVFICIVRLTAVT